MTNDRSKMRDGDMPLPNRIDVALRRVTSGEGQMRVPVEATDPDVVLHDCKREIERLRAEVRVLTNTPRPSQPDAAGVAWAHELFAMGSSNLCSLRLKENSDE